MEIKLFEIRDIGTLIPCFAIYTPWTATVEEEYLMRRAGFSPTIPCVIFGDLFCRRCRYDPFDWGDRTFFTAHKFIAENWFKLKTGDVIDVEYIKGESATPKKSERKE